MNTAIRTAILTAAIICLAGTASATVGYGTGTRSDTSTFAVRDISQPRERVQTYKTEEEAAATIAKWQREASENARKIPLSVGECRTITMDTALYHDTPASEFPPADQPMPVLSEIFREMLGMPWLQLVVTESREANDEAAIRIGFPIRWFRVVDIARAVRFQLEDGRQIVMSQAFEGVHKQNAGKLFANDQNIFIYDAAGQPLIRTDMFHLPDTSHIKSSEDFLRFVADTANIPLPEGSRAYTLAQHLLKTAALTEIPRR